MKRRSAEPFASGDRRSGGLIAWAAKSRRNYFVAFTAVYGAGMSVGMLSLMSRKGGLDLSAAIGVIALCFLGGLAFAWLFWLLFAARFIPKD